MNEKEFLIEIEKVDSKLAEKEVPIHNRDFLAFMEMSQGYDGPIMGAGVSANDFPPFVGPNLLNKISEWYKSRYGERHLWNPIRGKVPIIIRKEIYFIRIPLVFGNPKLETLPLVEGLTEDMIESLSSSELDSINETFEEGYALTYEIEDLFSNIKEENDQEYPAELLKKAKHDLHATIKCLERQIDTNGACFHAQQHAEKMLKSFLIYKKICSEQILKYKPYGHNIINIFNKSGNSAPRFFELTSEIGLLSNITMDVRYSTAKIPPKDAVSAFWAGIRVGGLCAVEISGHPRR